MRRTSLLFALALSLPLAAWGRKGHQIVARLAVQDLPPGPAAWFAGREEGVVAHSSDPDEWKHDPNEGPRHFLDVDVYDGHVPTLVSEARERLAPAVFRRAGQLPWVIQDRVKDLAQAFQAGDREQVALQASWLSHYVGDLHVPLHTVTNFDGQMTGQRGVHSRWETGLVDRLEGTPEPRPATLEPNLYMAPWRWLEHSHALAPAVLADDRACDGGNGRGARPEAYWMQFSKRQMPVVKDQLALAGQRTAQLVLLAWNLAGKPAPGTAPGKEAAPGAR